MLFAAQELSGPPAPPTPLELQAFVPYACKKLGAPFNVRVDVRTEEEYVSKIDSPKKQPKSKAVSRQPSAPETVKVEESETPTPFFYAEEGDEVLVTAAMDVCGRLVGIDFRSEPEVPCLLLKVIGMCVPFHPLLDKMSVRWSGLDGVALYEMARYLTASRLTELCLDDSPVSDRNYAVLLERPSQLKHLSLARCDLDDDDCVAICARLVHPLPAAATLRLLNLASNAIDDAGARALGEMLRGNRTLQYLNLSGNRISDAGARDIFESLVEFPLTAREIHDKRRRTMDHLKLRRQTYEECLREVLRENETARGRVTRKPPGRSARRGGEARGSLDLLASRAEALLEERLAAPADPFAPAETWPRARRLHCLGNRSLCYLNLCYNRLGYASVAGLARVLLEQSSGASQFGAGLVRALVEGNPLPEHCREYERLDELLEGMYRAKEALGKNAKKPDRIGRSKSQTLRSK